MTDLSALREHFENDVHFVGTLVDYLRHIGVLNRDRPNQEYEIKFKITDGDTTWRSILSQIEVAHAASERLLIEPRQERSGFDVTFFVDGDQEISRFTYDGVDMIKKKLHRCERHGPLYVYINRETIITDKAELDRMASETHRLPSASMWKNRIKDFVLDQSTGACYALAVTCCEAGSAYQHQVEVEYNSAVAGTEAAGWSEDQLIENLTDVAAIIAGQFPDRLEPTVERKFTFALHAT